MTLRPFRYIWLDYLWSTWLRLFSVLVLGVLLFLGLIFHFELEPGPPGNNEASNDLNCSKYYNDDNKRIISFAAGFIHRNLGITIICCRRAKENPKCYDGNQPVYDITDCVARSDYDDFITYPDHRD